MLAFTETGFAVMVAAIVAVLFLGLLISSLFLSRKARVQGTGDGVTAEPPAAAPKKATKPVSRRDFFRRSLASSLLLFGAQFGGASIAFLWPNLKGGFGSVINAGKVQDIRNEINSTKQPFYFGSGRFYVVPYGVEGSVYEDLGAVADGLMALYQRCVHLGCRVPFCQSSQWFECPCHGSKYNQAGEYELGPAPTGMERFKVFIDETGNLQVDTSTILPGPPRDQNTTRQSPQGPFCVGAG